MTYKTRAELEAMDYYDLLKHWKLLLRALAFEVDLEPTPLELDYLVAVTLRLNLKRSQ